MAKKVKKVKKVKRVAKPATKKATKRSTGKAKLLTMNKTELVQKLTKG